ncbi:hypothetical protein PMAYCL1PPCAC_07944, partial [Pristionchus mayeri]
RRIEKRNDFFFLFLLVLRRVDCLVDLRSCDSRLHQSDQIGTQSREVVGASECEIDDAEDVSRSGDASSVVGDCGVPESETVERKVEEVRGSIEESG